VNEDRVVVRTTSLADLPAIIALTALVYPTIAPWKSEQLMSHLDTFPEGQFVALLGDEVVGMAASLIVSWDDYDVADNWGDFTASGTFANHNPSNGRTLYGAEVMVHPAHQGQGIGSELYVAREAICRDLDLRRIRAGARLRGYAQHAATLSPQQYVGRVIDEEIFDATLSFQLRRGFTVIAVVNSYLHDDPESLGYAAVIEWQNPDATPK
jgi:GNAT superfamily N-acetyltransferase